MRFLVTGGSGLVGYRLVQSLKPSHDVAYTVFENEIEIDGAEAYRLDVRDRRRTESVVDAVAPDVVLHTAAMTDVDACERRPEHARAVNVAGTEHLVAAAEAVDADVTLLSTSFVFDGSRSSYKPDDESAPVNVYGETKLGAERTLERSAVEGLIIRTDQPYGWSTEWQSPTMVEWVLNQLSSGEPFPVFEDWSNCPTYLPDLVAVTRALVEGYHNGIHHCVGPDFLSRYAWAKHIADVFGYDQSLIQSGSATEADLPARRPNARLEGGRTAELTGVSPRAVADALEVMASERPGR